MSPPAEHVPLLPCAYMFPPLVSPPLASHCALLCCPTGVSARAARSSPPPPH